MAVGQKEVAVCFQGDQRSAGMPYRPIPSHFEHCQTDVHNHCHNIHNCAALLFHTPVAYVYLIWYVWLRPCYINFYEKWKLKRFCKFRNTWALQIRFKMNVCCLVILMLGLSRWSSIARMRIGYNKLVNGHGLADFCTVLPSGTKFIRPESNSFAFLKNSLAWPPCWI